MSKSCERCGKSVSFGFSYARRGLPKKVGGIGLKVTGKTSRKFKPNIQAVRVLEAGRRVRIRNFCTRCLKQGLADGTIAKAARRRHATYLAHRAAEEAAATT